MEINKISNDTQKSMKTRIITAIFIGIITIPCVILGDWFFVGLVALVAGFGIYEATNATGKKYPWYIYVLMYIFTYSFIFWIFFQNIDKTSLIHGIIGEYSEGHFLLYDIRISTMSVGLLIAILFTISIFSEKVDTKDVFYLFSMSLFLGISLQAVLFLRFAPPAIAPSQYNSSNYLGTCLLFCFVVAGTCLNDIFAYFVGVLFGKHKMNPRVSPKKTWEGFIGGIVLSTITTTLFAIVCDLSFGMPILKGYLDSEHWYFIIVLSLLISFSAVLGDLMFSLIKRSYSIKDFGIILPGHGGVLDRFDSLLITSLLATLYISFIVYLPLTGVIV